MALETCGFCDKPGLLLYPVRYAVACPAGASAVPGLGGNFKIENGPAEIASAKYALRGVRTGYLYTYDEKRDRLKAYLVMPGGHLWNFPLDLPAPTAQNKSFTCTNPVEESLSMCINIAHSDKDPAGVLWLGWSNTSWTKTLIKRIKNDEWRRKHMRRIDVPAMVKGEHQNHTAEFGKAANLISHFAMSEKQMQQAFSFSNTPISHEGRRQKMAEKFLKAFVRTPMKKGYIVAIDDPVGITNDLSELTIPTEHSGFDVALYRGRIIEEILQSAEIAIRQRARQDFDFKAAQRKIDDQYPTADGVSYSDFQEILDVLKAGGLEKRVRRQREEQKKYGVTIEAQRQAAEDSAWSEVSTIDGKSVLDAKKRATFPAKYKLALKDYEVQGEALAKAHVDWLTSMQLWEWMAGVHDETDLASGFAYRESLAQCVGKATATSICEKQLSEWLASADVLDIRNLYARAMLFNQEDIINAAEPQIKGGDVKLKNLLSIYKSSMDKLTKKQELGLVDKLIFTTANSLLRALGEHANRNMRDLTVISLSLLGKIAIAPSNQSPREVAKWIVNEAEKKGVNFGGHKPSAISTAQRSIEDIEERHPGIRRASIYEFDIRSGAQERAVIPGTVKAINIPGYATIEKWLSSSIDFNVGAVAVVLQLAAFAFAYRDFKVSDRFESNKLLFKVGIAVTSLSGAFMELAGKSLEKAPENPLSVVIKKHWAKGAEAGKKILLFGKVLGLIAGIATTVFDFYESYLAWLENDKTLATLFAINGVLGISVSAAGFFSLAVFWPLFVTMLILSIVIAVLKKSALTKWMSHCFFASNHSVEGQYLTLDEELTAFQDAFGG